MKIQTIINLLENFLYEDEIPSKTEDFSDIQNFIAELYSKLVEEEWALEIDLLKGLLAYKIADLSQMTRGDYSIKKVAPSSRPDPTQRTQIAVADKNMEDTPTVPTNQKNIIIIEKIKETLASMGKPAVGEFNARIREFITKGVSPNTEFRELTNPSVFKRAIQKYTVNSGKSMVDDANNKTETLNFKHLNAADFAFLLSLSNRQKSRKQAWEHMIKVTEKALPNKSRITSADVEETMANLTSLGFFTRNEKGNRVPNAKKMKQIYDRMKNNLDSLVGKYEIPSSDGHRMRESASRFLNAQRFAESFIPRDLNKQFEIRARDSIIEMGLKSSSPNVVRAVKEYRDSVVSNQSMHDDRDDRYDVDDAFSIIDPYVKILKFKMMTSYLQKLLHIKDASSDDPAVSGTFRPMTREIAKRYLRRRKPEDY